MTARIVVRAQPRRLSVKKVDGEARVGSRTVGGVRTSKHSLISTGRVVDILLIPKGREMDWKAIALSDFALNRAHFQEKYSRLVLSRDDAYVSSPSEERWYVQAHSLDEFALLENKTQLPGALRGFGVHEEDLETLTSTINTKLKL